MIIYGKHLSCTTTAAGTLYGSYTLYKGTIVDGKFQKDELKERGLLTTTVLGATTVVSKVDACSPKENYQDASAYIESLDDDQLAELEAKLEGLQLNDEVNETNVKTK